MTTDERDLYVEDHGAGPAVVLLHGVPSAPADFGPLVAALAGRRVLVPHFPGYGRTPAEGSPGASLGALTARLERSLAHRGVSKTDVVAFSGGAYKGLLMALGDRVAVGRLALIAPVVGVDPPVAQAMREMVAAMRASTFDPRPTWLARMASPGFAARDPAGAARVLAWLDAASLAVIGDELLAAADAPDLRPRLPTLPCSLWVCAGAADAAVPVAASEAVAKAAPRGAFQSFEGAGHAVLVEAEGPLVQALVSFLGNRR